MNEKELAYKLKEILDNHIKTAGTISSIMDYDISYFENFNNLNFQTLQEQCLKLNIYLDFIENTNLKEEFKPKILKTRIIFSYENIHK